MTVIIDDDDLNARSVKCAICQRNGPPELMKTFTGGFVHFLCDERERIAWRVGSREGQE